MTDVKDTPKGHRSQNDDDEEMSIRAELATMSFEELQKLKETLGVKVYTETLYGKRKKGLEVDAKQTRKDFKRANKNRPTEMSSKIPVGRHKDVFSLKKTILRDPRFDDLSGEFNQKIFEKGYSFLGDIKQKEKLNLQKQLKKEKDPERQEQIKFLLKRMEHQEKAAQDTAATNVKLQELRKKERESIKDGKKPFFLKKSEQKKLLLADKFQELKKSGKIEKYLQKKLKKNAAKDRRHIPKRHNKL
ncbi:PREDICTED: ribosomal RNA processing protein 36 homolog [Priapulus caudatus]|uniref:rRNA biogenesis protein RRP36 n=1 Tax=Priapulus caudatus TaxID=37621 RepID=A0ABM1DVE0_PRICU|nr:PREDICTED: ribosomal RNA processing protein 36 homolog [Priapulus caudatus]